MSICIKATVTGQNTCISATIVIQPLITATVSIVKEPIKAHITLLNPVIKAYISPVCSVGKEAYLRIEPSDYVWLTPNNNYNYDTLVYSNVEWTAIINNE